LVKLEICKFWLHYGAASIDKFIKGAVNIKSLGTAVLNYVKSHTVMLWESSIDITRAMGLVEDTRVGEFHRGWMKQAREVAEETGTNIPMAPCLCEFKCTGKTSELLHLMNATAKSLQFHFWTTC